MQSSYRYLFEPMRLGHVELRNRVFFPPHSTHYGDRVENDRHTAYYLERARGGVGLIVHEPVVVHPSSVSRRGKLWGWDEANVIPFQRTTTAVHAEGARIFCQLIHNGRQMTSLESERPLWAPSAIRAVGLGETPHEMTVDEIAEVVAGFGRSAAVCQAGGFDGVEIHGAHGYLVQAFLSPASNERSDAYGGSEERRRRFLREVVAAVRGEVGDDFVVGVRISGDELQSDGLGVADMQRLATMIEKECPIDYFSVVAGNYGSYDRIVPDMSHQWGVNVPLASGIRAMVERVPVLVAGRIAEPEQAEAILAGGDADMVGLARAQIADPHWVRKAEGRRPQRIRPCTYANECRSAIDGLRAVSCMVNPGAGRERELPVILERVTARRRVVVVGGGPAGMEFAATAADLGHEVTLVEAANRLGGQVPLAAAPSSRRDLLRLVEYQAAELDRVGVKIHLGQMAAAPWVIGKDPEVVAVATGARPRALPDGMSETGLRAWDVLTGCDVPAERVLVYDDADNAWAFCATIDLLSQSGVEVIAATAAATVGAGVDRASVPPLLRRLFERGVQFSTLVSLEGFDSGRALLRHRYSGERISHRVDAVVVETGTEADASLVQSLHGYVPTVLAVGDALAPRRIVDAIREGHRMARRLSEADAGMSRTAT